MKATDVAVYIKTSSMRSGSAPSADSVCMLVILFEDRLYGILGDINMVEAI